jgi:hypothetical protein
MIKYLLVSFILFSPVMFLQGQTASTPNDIVLTYNKKKTKVKATKHGVLYVYIAPKDFTKFKANGCVRYSDFGAQGNGTTDDINAIAATHAFANKHNLSVKADKGAVYYIGGKERFALIQTNTDFGTATFMIDDTQIHNLKLPVFKVSSKRKPIQLQGIASLQKGQDKIEGTLSDACLISVKNSNVKHYIRFGRNRNNGAPQTDIFLVDKKGNVDINTPIIWDFKQITDIKALPIDEKLLTLTGGRFITIANKAESKYTYYNRNIIISRSNVLVDGLEHRIIDEGDHGAPYAGFISIRDCSNVTVKNALLTGHKTYRTIGSAGKSVAMGTYDILVNRALNVSFINCRQTNDINDSTYWGIMASNYSKNLLFDNCTFSRFDAHMGVANASIRNSTLGYMGINIIGTGTFILENSTVHGKSLINLRSDYGSSWQGELIIRNCDFIPSNGKFKAVRLISGGNSGKHDFGYTCHMPKRILIENLHIKDAPYPINYIGPAIFANFNPLMTDASYKEVYPYIKTKEVVLKNITTASGKPLRPSEHPFLFKDVKIVAK